MELRHLRYFVAVADTLNFTKAAAALNLAQPSLTRQIQNLEDEIGVRLLDRSKKHVALTEEGRSFLVDARRLLALATESIQSVQRMSHGDSKQLNIGYLSNFNFDLLPKTLSAFRQDHPQVSLNLFDMTPAEQFRALEARKIDLGFVGLRFPAASESLQWECLARHKTVVALPIKHPLAKQKTVALRDLKTMFFVGMSEKTNPGFRDWLSKTCEPAGFTPRILQDAELEPGLMRLLRRASASRSRASKSKIFRIPASPFGRSPRPSRPSIGSPGTATTRRLLCAITSKS
jgi:DNA-binding transcriptional LysR family regulator